MPLNTYHWKDSVRGMSFFAAKKVLIEVDKKLYDRIVSEYGRRVEMRRLVAKKKEDLWSYIEHNLTKPIEKKSVWERYEEK